MVAIAMTAATGRTRNEQEKGLKLERRKIEIEGTRRKSEGIPR